MLDNSKEMLYNAMKNNYAVGAFNFTNFESLKAIVEACEKLKCSAILAVSPSAISYMGLNNIVALVNSMVKDSQIKYCLHLDHGKNEQICFDCIDAGFTSVMIDASDKDFETNVKITQSVVDYAHKHNVCVEAELGKLSGIEDLVNEKQSIYTNPQEARLFVKLTNVDSLAISIGTSHGAYKFKGDCELKLDILKDIKNNLPNTPLVLHGASSIEPKLIREFKEYGGSISGAKGVDVKSLKNAIGLGICKVNIDSDLRLACTTAIRKVLLDKKVFSPREYLTESIEKMQKLVENKITNVLKTE